MPNTLIDIDNATMYEIQGRVVALKDAMLGRLLRNQELDAGLVSEMNKLLADLEAKGFSQQLGATQQKSLYKTYQNAIGVIDGMLKDEGLDEILDVAPETVETVKAYTDRPSKITTLSGNLLKVVKSEVQVGFLGQRSPAMVARRIQKASDNFMWQAERIVRTENKKLANDATRARIGKVAGKAKDIGIPMKKVWLHSSVGASAGFPGKYKPRPHHRAMHGKSVGAEETFTLTNPVTGQTWAVAGPHDDNLPAGEVVNCYCNTALRIDRDAYKKRREEVLAKKGEDPPLNPPPEIAKNKAKLAEWYGEQTGSPKWGFNAMDKATLQGLAGKPKSHALEAATLSKKAHAAKYGKGKPAPPPAEPEVPKFPDKLVGSKAVLTKYLADETGMPEWMFKVAGAAELKGLAGKPKSAAVDLAVKSKLAHAQKYGKKAKAKAAAPKVIPKEQPPLLEDPFPGIPKEGLSKGQFAKHFAEQTGAPEWAFNALPKDDLLALVGQPKSTALEKAMAAKKAHAEKYKKPKAKKVKAPKPDTAPSKKAQDPAAKAHAAAVGQTKPQAALDADGFPDSPVGLVKVKSLGGSTGAELVEDPITGKKFVMKGGASEAHVTNEWLADELYRAGGVNVPKGKLLKTPAGSTVKLARFIDEAEPLAAVLQKGGPTAAKVKAQLQNDFVMDALLGNWDVAGLDLDNVIIQDGIAHRIDNGGALNFRAQGAKKKAGEFGPKVLELESMLDPNVNPQAAEIYSGIPDAEMKLQVLRMNKNREKILNVARATDPDLAVVLEKRMDFLTKKYDPNALKPKAKTPAAKRRATAEILDDSLDPKPQRAIDNDPRSIRITLDEDLAADVLEARGNGVAVAIDQELIEDGQVLVWEETNRFGEKVLRCEFKLNPEAQQRAIDGMGITKATLKGLNVEHNEATIAAKTGGAAADASGAQPLASDNFYAPLEAMAKNLNHHFEAGDNDYNEAKLGKFYEAMGGLGAWKPKTADEIAMKQKYEQLFAAVETAIDIQGMAPIVQQYTVPPSKAATGKRKSPGNTEFYGEDGNPEQSVEQIAFYEKTIERGRIRETSQQNALWHGTVAPRTRAIHVRGESVNVKMQPSFDGDGKPIDTGQADGTIGAVEQVFIGHTEISIKGGATPENIRKLRAQMEGMGIPTRTQSTEYLKALVLRKQLVYYEDRGNDTAALNKIMSSRSLTDAQKLEQMEQATQAANLNHRVNPENLPRANQWGHGHAAMSMPEHSATAADAMKRMNASVQHYSMDLPKFIKSVVEQGGVITSTRQRMRKGVSLAGTGGMFSDTDRTTGGADYFFTRVLRRTDAEFGTIEFKPHVLARADSFSYLDDTYGETRGKYWRGQRQGGFRSNTVKGEQGWLKATGSSGNETMFKNGLSLFDDVDVINVRTAAEKKAMIQFFKENGYDEWPDGRPLTKVIVAKS